MTEAMPGRMQQTSASPFSAFLHAPVAFDGRIVKDIFSSADQYKILGVEVEADVWVRVIQPAMQAAPPSPREASKRPPWANKAAKNSKLQARSSFCALYIGDMLHCNSLTQSQ